MDSARATGPNKPMKVFFSTERFGPNEFAVLSEPDRSDALPRQPNHFGPGWQLAQMALPGSFSGLLDRNLSLIFFLTTSDYQAKVESKNGEQHQFSLPIVLKTFRSS